MCYWVGSQLTTWRLCLVNSGKDLVELTLLMFEMLLNIKKTSLFLRLLGEVATDTSPGHSCEKCSYGLDEAACSVADNLPELEDNLSHEVRECLWSTFLDMSLRDHVWKMKIHHFISKCMDLISRT